MDDESSGASSGSESSESEPTFEYKRVGASVVDIMKTDAASAMASHPKFLVLGTYMGVVFVLDFFGNETCRYSAHASQVNGLTVDTHGEYIASCADDGKVLVSALLESNHVQSTTFNFDGPIQAVAIDPQYTKTREFVCGGTSGELVLVSKGWFGPTRLVVHSGEGAIHAITWHPTNNLIAFTTDIGVKIYDHTAKVRIGFVERPRHCLHPQLNPCCLSWMQGEDLLILAWGNVVQVIKVVSRPQTKTNFPQQLVHLVSDFTSDYIISGISTFGKNLLILASAKQEDEGTEGTPSSTIQYPLLQSVPTA